jgi:UMF1 family MFS transporter
MTAAPDIAFKNPGRRAVVAWGFFDWAAQPFFTLITTFVFAPYFASALADNPQKAKAFGGTRQQRQGWE